MVSLHVNLVAVSLEFDDGEVLLAIAVTPVGHEAMRPLGMLCQLVVGAQVEMLCKRLGLDGCHVCNSLAEDRFVILFNCTGDRGDKATVGQAVQVWGDYLDKTDPFELEEADMATLELPCFELIPHVLDSLATLDVEKLGVHTIAKEQHVVGL